MCAHVSKTCTCWCARNMHVGNVHSIWTQDAHNVHAICTQLICAHKPQPFCVLLCFFITCFCVLLCVHWYTFVCVHVLAYSSVWAGIFFNVFECFWMHLYALVCLTALLTACFALLWMLCIASFALLVLPCSACAPLLCLFCIALVALLALLALFALLPLFALPLSL